VLRVLVEAVMDDVKADDEENMVVVVAQ